MLRKALEVLAAMLGGLVRLLPASRQPYWMARLHARRFPKIVNVEPTTQCNLKCLHCGRTYWKERDQHRDMEMDLFERLAAETANWGVKSITIQGLGEPMLHPRIFDFIAFAKKVGHCTRFNSNFTIMSEEFAEKLVQSGHDEVMISVESFDPDMYADIRRKSTLEPVIRNIQLLTDAKKRLGSATPIIRVNAVLFLTNLSQIEEIVRMSRSLGAADVNFQGFNIDGIPENARLRDGTRMRENSLNSLSEAEIEAVSERIRKLDSPEFPVTMRWSISGRRTSSNFNRVKVCADIWEAPYVDSGGRVTPCCLLPDGVIMSLGNMQGKSFGEIWHGEAFNELRVLHLKGTPPDVCVNCQARNWEYDPLSGVFVNEHGEQLSNFFARRCASTGALVQAQETTAPRKQKVSIP